MNYPTAKRIEHILGVDKDKARAIRGLMDGTIDPMTYESVSKWVGQCYNKPKRSEMAMLAINEVLDGHGVESIHSENIDVNSYWGDIAADYVNMGDPYAATILYARSGYQLTSWGDFVERNRI